MEQVELFDAPVIAPIEGFVYRPEFLDPSEEAHLIASIAAWSLEPARYKGFTARRRVASFRSRYDFDDNRLDAAPPIPEQLLPLARRVAEWLGVGIGAFGNVLVSHYEPGTPLGWHRDVPPFDTVAGVSLGGACTMRFRRHPHQPGARAEGTALNLPLAARSAYILRGPARWQWQHAIAPTPGDRYSITFRTLR
jgi:alkylated DNA repair dioxygenase AlkB